MRLSVERMVAGYQRRPPWAVLGCGGQPACQRFDAAESGPGEIARTMRADFWVESTHVERYILAAPLKPGEATAAERTLLEGPPFAPAEAGLSAHAAYLTNDSVYLVFEGEAAHANALQLVREHLVDVSHWQSIVSELPSRVDDVPGDARCLYRWARQASA